MTTQTFQVTENQQKKDKPLDHELQFGRAFTDHMFVADYNVETGWTDHRIVPYEPFTLDPAAIIFHYGQTVFEGLKAYLSEDGDIRLFRPEENMKRMNQSCERLCMPLIDEEVALEGLKQLLTIDKEWIPKSEGTSLYIRPFIIATEPFLGVAPSRNYKFIIILSPVGSYYKEGINPVKIAVESKFVRAVKGGTGEAKTGGNYAAGLKGQEDVAKDGYSQVLWLDGVDRKYIEEEIGRAHV